MRSDIRGRSADAFVAEIGVPVATDLPDGLTWGEAVDGKCSLRVTPRPSLASEDVGVKLDTASSSSSFPSVHGRGTSTPALCTAASRALAPGEGGTVSPADRVGGSARSETNKCTSYHA